MKSAVKYVFGADILRIVSGFGVVFIHVTDPFLTYPPYFGIGGISWIILNIVNAGFRVSVPLFIMLSGYLLLDPGKNYDFKTFFKKRFLRVGLPFLFWLVFYFIWQYNFIGVLPSSPPVLHRFLSVDISHLYFLVIIVELYFITPLFTVFLRNTSATSHKVLVISSIIFTLLLSFINAFAPLAKVLTHKNILTIFLPFVSYYLLGFALRKTQILKGRVYYAFVTFLAFVLFTALASDGVVNSYLRSYGSPNILIMCIISFLILIQIEGRWKIIQNTFILSQIKMIASCMFGVFLVHMIVIEALDRFFPSLRPGLIGEPLWAMVFFKVIVVFIISLLAVMVGKRIPYIKVLFG